MAAIEDGLVSSPTVQNTLHRHLKVSIKSPCLKGPSLFIQNTEPYCSWLKKTYLLLTFGLYAVLWYTSRGHHYIWKLQKKNSSSKESSTKIFENCPYNTRHFCCPTHFIKHACDPESIKFIIVNYYCISLQIHYIQSTETVPKATTCYGKQSYRHQK